MSVILIDGLKMALFHNGIMRVDCIMNSGPNGEERPSGTLLIPGNQAKQVLEALVGAAQELDRQMRAQVQKQDEQVPTGKA